MTMFPKASITRLKGEPLRRLVKAVFDRDNHSCIVCGRWVEEGVKPHHEPPGYGRKNDDINHMVVLCDGCHYERHHGKHSAVVRGKVEEYLAEVGHGVFD